MSKGLLTATETGVASARNVLSVVFGAHPRCLLVTVTFSRWATAASWHLISRTSLRTRPRGRCLHAHGLTIGSRGQALPRPRRAPGRASTVYEAPLPHDEDGGRLRRHASELGLTTRTATVVARVD